MVGILSKLRIGKDKDKEKKTDEKGKSSTTLTEPLSPVKNKRASIHSLLEGKFESISPVASHPPKLEESKELAEKEKEKEKEKSKIPLLRAASRSKAHQQVSGASRRSDDVPQLTLNLNLGNGNGNGTGVSGVKGGAKKVRDLGIVFEAGAESAEVWDEKALGEKKLSPAEAARLIRVCASTINVRGVDTLGIMHPHWYSSSPAQQRKIIALFLSSLASSGPSSSSASTPASPSSAASAFESEIEFPRSLHDVAAVFRWALRHVTLDGGTFGRIGEGEPSGLFGWYDAFAKAERDMNYPELAFSELLLPRIKQPHVDLLMITTGVIESLAARSEFNGVSGSKLSMTFGHHLLTGNRVDGLDSWQAFYSQWERAGRALEHIFLARLRDEAKKEPIPKRLAELIAGYPFLKYSTDDRFPRSRLSTRAFDALHIRITTEVVPGTKIPLDQVIPLRIVENSLRAEDGEEVKKSSHFGLWEEIKVTANKVVENEKTVSEKDAKDNSDIQLSRILADESIRLLSLKGDTKHSGTPTITMFSQMSVSDSHKEYTPLERNASARKGPSNGQGALVSRGPSKATTSSSDEPTSPILSDWNLFSSTGFGEPTTSASLAATLLDSDIEKTEPPDLENKRYLRKSRSPARLARDAPLTVVPPPISQKPCKTESVSIVRLDEAFVDFWADALLDPVADSWPPFAVCQLKADAVTSAQGSGQGQSDGKVGWLVIEQAFVPPTPPPPSSTALDETTTSTRRPSSPKPSTKSDSTDRRAGATGRISSTFSVTRKRFNFFGGSLSQASVSSPSPSSGGNTSDTGKKSTGAVVQQRVGEMGEIIKEEVIPEDTQSHPAEELRSSKTEEKENSESVPFVAAAVVTGSAAVLAASDDTSTVPEDAVTSNGKAHEQEELKTSVSPASAAPEDIQEVPEESKALEAEDTSVVAPVSNTEEVKVEDVPQEPEAHVEENPLATEHEKTATPSVDASNTIHTEANYPESSPVTDGNSVPHAETTQVASVVERSEEEPVSLPAVDAVAVTKLVEEVKTADEKPSGDVVIPNEDPASEPVQSEVVDSPVVSSTISENLPQREEADVDTNEPVSTTVPHSNPPEDRPHTVPEENIETSTSIPEEKEEETIVSDSTVVVEENSVPPTTIHSGAAESRFVEHVDSSPEVEAPEEETIDGALGSKVVDETGTDDKETEQDRDVTETETVVPVEQPLETIPEQPEVKVDSTSVSPVPMVLEEKEEVPEVEEVDNGTEKLEAEEKEEIVVEGDSNITETSEPVNVEDKLEEEVTETVNEAEPTHTEAEPQPEVTKVPTSDETVIEPKELSTEPSEEQEQEQEVSVETAEVPPSTESQNGVDVAAVEEEAESDQALSSKPESSSIPAGTE